ncbi:DNA primase [Acrasis kona]|uniref:DNA primase n=1 Tax=Acrasis kona TaxID=1008807 RepID=A0AAW2ZCK7_9EUKA
MNTQNSENFQRNEKLTFRQPRPKIIEDDIEETTTNSKIDQNVQNQKLKDIISVNEDSGVDSTIKEDIKNEPKRMFFYYPKYLHPEAVTLIAQNLLQEWEQENQS